MCPPNWPTVNLTGIWSTHWPERPRAVCDTKKCRMNNAPVASIAIPASTSISARIAGKMPAIAVLALFVAALTLVGMEGVIDLRPEGRPVRTLLKAAAELSARIGAPSAAAAAPAVTFKTDMQKFDAGQPKRRFKALDKAS